MKRKDQKVMTRNKLFDTSIRLFKEQGFEQVTVDNIVLAAGVSKGTFYHHFVSKSAVLLDYGNSIHQELAGLLAQLTADADQSGTGTKQLEQFFAAILAFYKSHFDGVRLLAEQSAALHLSASGFSSVSTELISLLQLLLERGKRAGQFAFSVDSGVVSEHIVILFYHALRESILGAENPSAFEFVIGKKTAELLQFAFWGLRVPSP